MLLLLGWLGAVPQRVAAGRQAGKEGQAGGGGSGGGSQSGGWPRPGEGRRRASKSISTQRSGACQDDDAFKATGPGGMGAQGAHL